MHSTVSLVKTCYQLTQEQGYQISAKKRIGHSQTEIAKELEVHKSTIGRELSRNRGERGNRPKQTNEKALERRTNATPTLMVADRIVQVGPLSGDAFHSDLRKTFFEGVKAGKITPVTVELRSYISAP